MRNKKLLIILAIIGLLSAFGLYKLFANLEYEDVEIHTGFTGKARVNEYLALQRFLEKNEINVEADQRYNRDNFYYRNQRKDLLFAPVTSLPSTGDNLYDLKIWLKEGNILFTGNAAKLETKTGYSPEFLNFINLSKQMEPAENSNAISDFSYCQKKNNFDMHLTSHLTPKLNCDIVRDSNKNVIFFVRRIGQGRLIFFNDLDFMTNENIAQDDHAELFSDLISKNGSPDHAIIVYRKMGSVVFSWLIDNAKTFGWASTLLVIALILLRATVLAPKQTPPSRRRNRLTEHLSACGSYLWSCSRANRGRSQFLALRKDILELIYRLHPELINEPTHQQIEQLSEITGIASKDLVPIFNHKKYQPQYFTANIATIQNLRNKLWKR